MYSKVFNHFQKKFDYEAYFYSVYVPLTENPKMRNNEKNNFHFSDVLNPSVLKFKR